MTEAQMAIAELTEISSQVEVAVLFDGSGAVAAATLPEGPAARLASSALNLVESAERVREGGLTQIEVATAEGSVFVIREGDQLIAAVTEPSPTAGLVFYDLKSCLRRAAEKPKPKRKRRPPAKASGST